MPTDLLTRAREAVTVEEECDPITAALRAAQKPRTDYLWTPSHTITFTPRVLTEIFGDGRALFYFGTLNSRPAYWLVRGDSRWTCDLDWGADPPDGAEDFRDHDEEILCALEEEFGSAESGEDYLYNRAGRPYHPETGQFLSQEEINYPTVNTGGGWHWGREDWPDMPGVQFVPHPLHPDVRLIALLEAGNAHCD